MKKIILLLTAVCLAGGLFAQGQEFKWARVKFKCKEKDAQEKWDIDKKADITFLDNLEKYTTLKVSKEWNIVTLDNLEEMSKYPLLFMTASGTADLDATEIKNLGEYLKRGGFLLCDDSNWGEKGGNVFVASMKKYFEQLFPKNKITPMGLDHDLLRAQFDMPLGYWSKLYFDGEITPSGVWTLSDDKGRVMVFFTLLLQNCWGGIYFRPEKQEESIKMGINMVMYSLTH